MSKIEKVLIIMIVIIVTAFSLTQKKLAEMMYTDEINQHEKDVKTLIVQYDSLKMITFESIKLTYMYDSISNDAIDSAVKYKKLYLKNK